LPESSEFPGENVQLIGRRKRCCGGTAPDVHYSGFDADANACLTAEVSFSQWQANEPSGQGTGAIFDRLAADFADGNFLGVNKIGGPIVGRNVVVMPIASATEMLFCC
jgi:hypothetical protein